MMPYKTHGISSETVKNMLFDAGAVYLNYGETDERLLGATSGGNSFTIEREVKEIEADGARGKVKGLRRIITHNASLTINLLELSAENLRLAITAADLVDENDDEANKIADKIVPRQKILDTDYFKNIALVTEVSGSNEPCVIILHNVLPDNDEFALELEDKEEGKPEIVLSAHYDPDDLDTVPYEIIYPVVD